MTGPLKATIDFKVKGNAVKQEVEKNQELVRSALRAVAALSKLADAGEHRKQLTCQGATTHYSISSTVVKVRSV
jgi:hypothetical protein